MVWFLQFLNLQPLPVLDLLVYLESSERFVTGPVVVESQSEVLLDLLLPYFCNVRYPLLEAFPLQAQEPENCCICLHLTDHFVLSRSILQVMEPPPLQHQSLDLLALFLLETCCSV